MGPDNPDMTYAPLNPTGPLCRGLRAPQLLRELFQRLGREKQRRLFDLLKLDRNHPVNFKLVLERWLVELDTPAGRQRFADRVTPFPRLLIEYVEAQSPSDASRFSKYILWLGPKQGAYSRRPYRRNAVDRREGARRALQADLLTSELAAKLISQNQSIDFVCLYVVGWAMAQPGSATQICRHFLDQCPQFRDAVLGTWSGDTFANEWQLLEEQQISLTQTVSETRDSGTTSASDEEGFEPVPSEPASSPTYRSAESEPEVPKSQPETTTEAPLVPTDIQELLRQVFEREKILKRALVEENYNLVTRLGQDRDEAIAALRDALGCYYAKATDCNVKFHDIHNNKRNYDSIYSEVNRLFSSLAQEHKRSFQASRRKLFERLKAAELQHLWEEPGDLTALQAIEQRLEASLRIHEAATAILSGRVAPSPSALPNLSTEERIAAAELAVKRAVHDIDSVLRHGVDLSPLARLLLQTGICYERPDLIPPLLLTFAKQKMIPPKLAGPLVQLTFAAAQAMPGRSGWELLLIDAQLASTLVAATPDALDALLAEFKAQSAVLDTLVVLVERDPDVSKLVVALAERLRAQGQRGEAIELLAAWLYLRDPQKCQPGEMATELCRLRDHLCEDDRQAEAMLLVTRALRAGHHSIAGGFEERLTNFLLSMTKRKDSDAQKVLDWALADASWLVEQSYGVVALLYICHLADRSEQVLNARFQYADAFDRARRFFPVLVDAFFLGSRFTMEPGTGDDASSYASRMLEELNAFQTGLRKRSCYRSWPPAEDYQRFFNGQLEELFAGLMEGDMSSLISKLEQFDPDLLIEEADRTLGESVRHPAIGLMHDYLQEQIEHLRKLAQARQRLGVRTGLEEALKSRAVSLADRLNQERSQNSRHGLVDSIYESLAGASRSS